MKATHPTRPWLIPARSPHGGGLPRYTHAPSYVDDEVPVALCATVRVLADPAPELPPCPRCIRILTDHGLWPL